MTYDTAPVLYGSYRHALGTVYDIGQERLEAPARQGAERGNVDGKYHGRLPKQNTRVRLGHGLGRLWKPRSAGTRGTMGNYDTVLESPAYYTYLGDNSVLTTLFPSPSLAVRASSS